MTGAAQPGKWGDLSRRVASTVVLLGIGVLLATAQGIWLVLGMAVISAVTFWELAMMTGADARRSLLLAGLAFAGQVAALTVGGPLMLVLPLLVGAFLVRDRAGLVIFGAAIMLAGFGLVGFRTAFGLPFVLWLMGIVIISDTAGYFVGRVMGGPKFWPSLSPKKTWSGTVAGWVGAAILGVVMWSLGHGHAALIWMSPLVAFAGQMGDIAESGLKRRAGVKDSSNLIPGHGGFMDRFDAVTGAVLAAMLIGLFTTLPDVG
ncbi:phosphatidate cytidylyltransferase [Paracoccus sp. (in: a-proteobacteria)]|uniref:phosphatidate cytidylyltransferase n=1 Tax=Paracoccus sp. TaxID=267 RepID=UPI0026E0BF2C|nr:phosphatidate cytidylyltransferase [Paracoccus sp. (in: a-proteobacteria)]MDO5646844.1 phosphatidate cytidylyltransferase [Paracoccus sp. (in: a-proteobacteria)]